MIKISKQLSLQSLERGLTAIASGERRLQLPNSFKANSAGTEPALLQLVITWARKANGGALLRLYADSEELDVQTTFARTVFGLVALNFADLVEDQKGQELDRISLLSLSRPLVVAMAEGALEELQEMDRTSLPFLCVDNAREYRRPARLYLPGTDQVRSRSDFETLVSSAARSLLANRDTGIGPFLEEAALLLHEAFQNTHDHAQTDHRGKILRRSARGITLGRVYSKLDELIASTKSSGPLQEYYRGWKTRWPNAEHAQFLELGVFDSGPGLARRWLAREPEIADALEDGRHIQAEYDAVRRCLAKGATTKSGGTSGNGLYRIMQAVKRTGGFIQVRTGHLSLVKAFDDGGLPLVEDDLRLVDTFSGLEKPRRREWAEGTAISVLIPTNREMAR